MTTREETIKNKKKNMKKKKNEKQRERVSKSKAAFLTCHSSNRKRLHPHGQHHLRWSTTVSDSEPDHEDTTTVTRSLPSSDFLLMHMASRGNNNNNNNINPCSSSLASCPAFSLASLDDKCPSTPSPVCSPLSSDLLLHHSTTTTPPPPLPHHHHHHHHHDQQSICAMANGCKKLVVGQEVSPLHKIIREGGEGGEKQSWTPKSNGSAASRLSRSACKYLLCDKEIMGDNNNCDCEDGGRVMLPVLVEEKEDKRCNKGDRHLPPPTQSSHFSADDDDDEYYTRSSSGGRGSEEYDGNSENASMVGKEERVKPMNGIGIDPPDIRTEVEAKLNAWKEAKTYKLLNKLMFYPCIPSMRFLLHALCFDHTESNVLNEG
ncbi:hypothetical protein DsansV1_C32g0222711 [Dioscorea sansibarensis]